MPKHILEPSLVAQLVNPSICLSVHLSGVWLYSFLLGICLCFVDSSPIVCYASGPLGLYSPVSIHFVWEISVEGF